MSKRGPGPTLYDLIQNTPRSGSDEDGRGGRAPAPVSTGPPSPEGASFLQPGRQITVPVGVVLVVIAVFIGGVIGAYALGHLKGDEAARAEFETARAEESNKLLNERAVDPLGQRPMGNAPVQDLDGGSGGVPDAGSGAGSDAETGRSEPSSWGRIDAPALQVGLTYFVVAETRSEGARRLAEFLRSEGLEAYVILGNNARSRDRVVVFPGMEDPRASTVRADLERAIQMAGQKWKAANRGESDLSDFYPYRYNG